MGDEASLGHLAVPYVHIPSYPMIIRRYRSLNDRNIRTFFEKGLFCRNLPTFIDDNEGLVEQAIENTGMKAAGMVISNMMRRRRGLPELQVSDEEFKETLTDFHKESRRGYYANCWRIGSDEVDQVWKEYTGDENMREGFAFETTVGKFVRALPTESEKIEPDENVSAEVDEGGLPVDQMYVGHPHTSMHIGAVWYQKRQMPGIEQPAGYRSAVIYFKGSGFNHEREFRFSFNPHSSANLVRFGLDGLPAVSLPDTVPEFHYFPIDTKDMIERIVLAPKAGPEQREKIEGVLDDLGISYGSGEDDDLEIVESNQNGSPLHQRVDYTAEFGGTDNYDGDEDYLNRHRESFIDNTDAEKWPVCDLVELVNERAGTVIENYRHASGEPVFDPEDLGHDGYQATIVKRFFARGEYEEYWNQQAKDELSEPNEDEDSSPQAQ